MRLLLLTVLFCFGISSIAFAQDLYGTWKYESLVLDNNSELKSSEDGRKMLEIIKEEFSEIELTLIRNGNFKLKMKSIDDFGRWKHDAENKEIVLTSKTTGISYYRFVGVSDERLVLGIEGGVLNFKKDLKKVITEERFEKSAYAENIKICKKKLAQKWQLVEYFWPHNDSTTVLHQETTPLIICRFEKDGTYVFNSGGVISEGKWEIKEHKKSFITTPSNGRSLTWQVKALINDKLVIYRVGDNNYWVLKLVD